jgi:hypothetical protein
LTAASCLTIFLDEMITALPSLADRFAWLFDGLCKAIGVDAQRQRMEAALAWVIWHRVRMLGDRLIALAERVRAGRLPRRRVRRSGTPHPSPAGQEAVLLVKRRSALELSATAAHGSRLALRAPAFGGFGLDPRVALAVWLEIRSTQETEHRAMADWSG